MNIGLLMVADENDILERVIRTHDLALVVLRLSGERPVLVFAHCDVLVFGNRTLSRQPDQIGATAEEIVC